jgi:WD40 repeat protein
LNGFADTVDISPDGSTVLGADGSGNVLLWDVATATTIGDPLPGPGPDDNWLAAYFSPDGSHIVVVSETGSGWLWDVDPSDWENRACRIAGRSLTRQEWEEFLPDRTYHATCGS